MKEAYEEVRVPCIVFSRVVGYYRPTFCWNDGKNAEWNERTLIKPNGNIKTLDQRLRTNKTSLQ